MRRITEWVESTDAGRFIDVHDSNNGAVFARVIDGSKEDTIRAIEAAAAAFKIYSTTTVAERKAFITRILDEYAKRKHEIADNLQRELGSPKTFAERVQVAQFPMHLQAPPAR